MKAITTLLTICLLGALAACQGQVKKEKSEVKGELETTDTDSSKSMNMLDEQTKIFGQVFTLAGMSDEENPTGGATNYLELIEKTEMPDELKQEIRALYEIYDLSLDPKKKAEFELKLNKKLKEGMDKAMIEQQ